MNVHSSWFWLQKHNLETTFVHIKSNSTQNHSYSIYIFGTRQGLILDIYIRLKYDHKKSSTDTPTMIYTKHILKTKWLNFCQVLLKEWCKIQSIIFLPNFNYTLKSLKKKYRCLKTTDFNRLHIPHYDWNFFIPSKSYRILQKLWMSILNNQTESASIQASQWHLYAGIVVNYYQNGL